MLLSSFKKKLLLPQFCRSISNHLTNLDKFTSSIIQDFIQDQAPYKSLLEEWFNNTQSSQKRLTSMSKTSSKVKEIKTPRRGSNSILRMKERKEQRQMQKQFQLKEIVDNGEKRYLVVKKKAKNSIDEVEDIFADWNKNLSIIKRPRSSKPRQRKLSHRQERRELLKSVEEATTQIGPMTYAEMLRRGLKKPTEQEMMEDIFHNFTNFLDELTEIREQPAIRRRSIVDELDFFKVWKHNLHVPTPRMEDVDIMASTHPSILPGLDCGQPTVKMAVVQKKQEVLATKMPTATSTKKKAKSPPGFSSKQNVKVLPGQGKQIIPKAEPEKPKAIPTPPPPPPAPTPVKKPYEPVAPNKQLLPFVEKPLIAIPPPPPMPPKPAPIPLADLTKKTKLEMKPKSDFKPSAHSQRMLTPPKPIAPPAKVESKPKQPTAEQIYECAKNSSNKSSWQNMLICPKSTSPTGRGDSKRKLPSAPEEVFQSWRYIFTEENKQQKRAKFVVEEGYECLFKEWALVNLKEPEPRKSVVTDESPKSSRKELKKQIKCENIEDDMTEFKDNRRHDFAKNASIKDKKRSDAARKSTGRKIK